MNTARRFFSVILLIFASVLPGASIPPEIAAETKPQRRAELAISEAMKVFSESRRLFDAGDPETAGARLDQVKALVSECWASAQNAHRRHWKKLELRVSKLTRGVRDLEQDVDLADKEKVRELGDQLNGIHDKLLQGVLSK